MYDVDKALEAAHYDYLKRQNEIITKLLTISNNRKLSKTEIEWIGQAIEFIKEKEI